MRSTLKLSALLILEGALAAFCLAQEAAPAKPEGTAKTPAKKAAAVGRVKAPPKGAPLKHLKKQKDGHWSPYKAPEYPESTTVHTVAKGDTLSGLASKELGNAFLWPQIWEKNDYVKNPHWIYPGDPLLIGEPKLVDAKASDQAEPDVQEAAHKIILPPDTLREAVPQNLISVQRKEIDLFYNGETENYGTGTISKAKLGFDTFIVGAEDERDIRNLGEGHVVYLNKGMKQNVFPGSRFQITRSGGDVHHPANKHLLGYYYAEVGTLKVILAHDDNAVAQIEMCTRPVFVGDALIPLAEKTKIKKDKAHKFQRFVEDNGKATGNLVFINDACSMAGAGQVVYIDLGKDRVAPGQFCTLYRTEGKFKEGNEFREGSDYMANLKEKEDSEFHRARNNAVSARKLPRIILGELVVLETGEQFSKAKVVESVDSIPVGCSLQVQ